MRRGRGRSRDPCSFGGSTGIGGDIPPSTRRRGGGLRKLERAFRARALGQGSRLGCQLNSGGARCYGTARSVRGEVILVSVPGEAAASYDRTSPRGSLGTVAARWFGLMDIQAGATRSWFERFGWLYAMQRRGWMSRGSVGGVGSASGEGGAVSSCVRVLSLSLCTPVSASAAAIRGITIRH